MHKIKAPGLTDYSLYSEEEYEFSPRYGLPSHVDYCKKCVISNQRPSSSVEFKSQSRSEKKTISFDRSGVCDACKVAEIKNRDIDWKARDSELMELCNRYRKNNGEYDCIVPGSGGKDSWYASHILKTKYGMHPLTVTWAPHIYTDWGWRNFQAWIHAGFDNLLFTPNGKVHRLLTRLALENLLHPFQPFMLGQKNIAPRLAERYGISLIFYGENEAEYGNPISDTDRSTRGKEYFCSSSSDEIYLSGTSYSDLISDFQLSPLDLNPYLPIGLVPGDPQDGYECDVRYLGYYLKWHPQSCFYYAVENGGFEASPERTCGTYSKYSSIDDKMDDLHYYTTGIKFGIGRASYDASQEIRSGDISREEGVALVTKYDHEYPSRFENELFEYLSINVGEFGELADLFEEPQMTRQYFELLCNNYRSPHLWVYSGDGWRLRHPLV